MGEGILTNAVYQNAHLTIAATASTSSEEGTLRRPSPSLIRITANGEIARATLSTPGTMALSDSLLFGRAWVLSRNGLLW